MSVAQNLRTLRERIAQAARRFGREPEAIRLLAVSKTKPVAAIREALAEGQQEFGENYLQDALPKIEAFSDRSDLSWHFIGGLQSNKTRQVAENFAWVQSLDNPRHARRLNDQRPEGQPPLQVCVQVNLSRESRKSGVPPEDCAALAEQVAALPRLQLRGLMAIPAPGGDFSEQCTVFRQLRELYQFLRQERGLALDTLSMGMTDDLEAAIAEGSTLLRIGTAIFGARDYTSKG